MEKDNVIKMKRPNAELSRYIEFSLGNEDYAIPLQVVREVVSFPDITPIEKSPEHLLGTMQLRGQSISIIDIRKKLKITPNAVCEEAVAIIDIAGINIGIVVDSINRVLAFSIEEVSELPENANHILAQFILGIFQKENSLTHLLDIGKVLDLNDHHEIDAWKKAA